MSGSSRQCCQDFRSNPQGALPPDAAQNSRCPQGGCQREWGRRQHPLGLCLFPPLSVRRSSSLPGQAASSQCSLQPVPEKLPGLCPTRNACPLARILFRDRRIHLNERPKSLLSISSLKYSGAEAGWYVGYISGDLVFPSTLYAI